MAEIMAEETFARDLSLVVAGWLTLTVLAVVVLVTVVGPLLA